jgi:predicted RND superfamily exporter protein
MLLVPDRRASRMVLAAVLVLSAGGFAWASQVERSKDNTAGLARLGPEGSAAREAAERSTPSTPSTTAVLTSTPPTTTAPTTTPEGSPAREAAERAARTTTSAAPITVSQAPTVPLTTPSPATTVVAARTPVVGETLFGIRTESTGTTAAVVVALLAAALLALIARRRWMLLGVAVFAVALAVLDAREALHQHDEGRSSLVLAALALAAGHLAASGLGLISARQT